MNISTPSFSSKKFQSASLKGHALGMHTWGAERPIDPKRASLSVYDHSDSVSINVSMGGPVTEKGFEGRSGYHSSAFFHDFPKDVIKDGKLQEGTYKKGNKTLSYEDGTLTLTGEETYYEPGFLGFGWKEKEINSTVITIQTDETFSEIGQATFQETSRDRKFFGGYEEPETITDVSMENFLLTDLRPKS